MTAAAIRPDLFTHLFATQRQQREKSDVAATVLSLALHGSVVLALVLASTRIKPAAQPIVETVNPIVLGNVEAAPRPADGGGSHGAAPGLSLVAPHRFDAPIIDVPDPLAGDPLKDFAKPGDPPGLPSKDRPGSGRGDTELPGGFEVRSVAPALLNPHDVQRALERNYPAMLRDAGVGGRVILWLLLDESGHVLETKVRESSGQTAFDNAARKVGQTMRFSPAMNRDEHVKVWVSLAIVFTTR